MAGTALEGRVVLVAGASTGIGNGVVRAAVERGARAIVMLARRDMSEQARELATDATRVVPISVDLADACAVEHAAERVRTEVGTPDVIVMSSASGTQRCIEELTAEEFASAMASCVLASFHVVRAFIDEMLRDNRGHIVFVGSSAYITQLPYESYMARVAALHGFYRGLRTDLRQDSDNAIRLTWCEPPYVIDNDYLKNNAGMETRGPVGFDPDRVGMTSTDIGRAIVRAIEAGRNEWRPLWLSVLLWLYRFTPLSVVMDRTAMRYLPPEEGGPPCGHRQRLLSRGGT